MITVEIPESMLQAQSGYSIGELKIDKVPAFLTRDQFPADHTFTVFNTGLKCWFEFAVHLNCW